MKLELLPFSASIDAYNVQATELLAALRAGDSAAIQCFKHTHPAFRRADVPWLARSVSDAEVTDAGFGLDDARVVVARARDFRDWPALEEYARAVNEPNSQVQRFEQAVEAVIGGNLSRLEAMLRESPGLVHARSTRINPFDPPVHRATLLTYIAANGVENHRQKTPANAVHITKALLQAGAEADALADLYGGQCTTLSLLVSSCHPANAGLQVALTETLLDFGASPDGVGEGRWVSPLMTALAFGYMDAAEVLARRGARVDSLPIAAGLGRLDDARQLLPEANAESRHRALALAAQLGHVGIVHLLLDAGENPDRYNPDNLHSHATPLHHAALHGHRAVVELLVERGARLDLKDKIYQSTPLGWALHANHAELAAHLRAKGAR